MESSQAAQSRKRSIQDVGFQELASKFRSKQDFVQYLDKT